MMNRHEAMEKLPEYLDGGLSALERQELERFLKEDSGLRSLAGELQVVDRLLRNQQWLTPAPDFTQAVLAQIEMPMEQAVATKVRMWDRMKAVLSAAALLTALLLRGPALLGWFMQLLDHTGNWLGSLTGESMFALHPILILGLIAPLLAGGYVTCVLAGKCRLNP